MVSKGSIVQKIVNCLEFPASYALWDPVLVLKQSIWVLRSLGEIHFRNFVQSKIKMKYLLLKCYNLVARRANRVRKIVEKRWTSDKGISKRSRDNRLNLKLNQRRHLFYCIMHSIRGFPNLRYCRLIISKIQLEFSAWKTVLKHGLSLSLNLQH